MNTSTFDTLNSGLLAFRTLILLGGVGVCLMNLSLSRWVKMILMGFIGMIAAQVVGGFGGYFIGTEGMHDRFERFLALSFISSFISVFSLGLIVLGLGILLWELKRRQAFSSSPERPLQ